LTDKKLHTETLGALVTVWCGWWWWEWKYAYWRMGVLLLLLFLLEILLGSDDEIRLRSFDMLCADDVPFQNFVAGTGNVPSGLVVHPDREHLLYPLGSSIVVEGIAGKRKQAFLLVRPRFSHNSWDTYPVRSPSPPLLPRARHSTTVQWVHCILCQVFCTLNTSLLHSLLVGNRVRQGHAGNVTCVTVSKSGECVAPPPSFFSTLSLPGRNSFH
jgi:hypothetical protein